MQVTLMDMIHYLDVLSRLDVKTEKILKTIEFLENEIHISITTMKRMEITNG